MDRLLSQPCIQLLPFFVDSPPLISSGNCQSVVAVEVLECLKEEDMQIVHTGKFVSHTPKFGIKFVTSKAIHRVISEPESNLSPSQQTESLVTGFAWNSPQSSFAAKMASGVVNGKCDVSDDTMNMISERYCNRLR